MKKNLLLATCLFIAGAFFIGLLILDPHGSKTTVNVQGDVHQPAPYVTNLPIIYTDNFDAANDTTALKARGYKVWYRGGGPQGPVATWFQGNSGVFAAYNGPSTGYVAANYQVVTGTNDIDSWLVLPYQAGGYFSGDSISFFSQAPLASTFPDSVTVSYSSVGDSIPEGSWVLVGKFKVNTLGIWEKKSFLVPTTSATGRIAIRYKVVGGGPSGLNSDYIGIDALNVSRSTVGIEPIGNEVPNSYSLRQNYPNPFNPATNIRFGLPKSGKVKLVVFDITGRIVKTLVNKEMAAGNYAVDFNASSLSSGVYFYRIEAGEFTATKKMLLVK